jgi:hypothetical protein
MTIASEIGTEKSIGKDHAIAKGKGKEIAIGVRIVTVRDIATVKECVRETGIETGIEIETGTAREKGNEIAVLIEIAIERGIATEIEIAMIGEDYGPIDGVRRRDIMIDDRKDRPTTIEEQLSIAKNGTN